MLAGTCARAQGADEKHLLASLRGISGDDGAHRACRMGTKRRWEELTKCGLRRKRREPAWRLEPRSAQRHHKRAKREAYIWDKAQELGLAVAIDVTVEEDGSYPYPAAVRITGPFTEPQRQSLTVHRRKPCHREGAADLDERNRTPDLKKWGLKLRRVIETWRLPLLILALGALIPSVAVRQKDEPSAAKPEAAPRSAGHRICRRGSSSCCQAWTA